MALMAHTIATPHKGKRGARGGCGCDPPTDPAAPPFSMRSAVAEEGTARSDPLREVVRVIRASNEGPLNSKDN